MLKNENIISCVYCGSNRNLTHDHIPPKCLFSKPRPVNLITVPCCITCNNLYSKEDEYFRLALNMRFDTYEYHPDVKANWPIILRSLKKPNKLKFKFSLFKSLKETDLYAESGIYLGKTAIHTVDPNRIIRSIERICKGIFYIERGYRFPNNYNIKSYSLEAIKLSEDLKVYLSLILNSNKKTIGRDVFSYWSKFSKEDQNTGSMIFIFYKKVPFLTFITIN